MIRVSPAQYGQSEGASRAVAVGPADMTWEQRLNLVFKVETKVCSYCGGAVISCSVGLRTIKQILSIQNATSNSHRQWCLRRGCCHMAALLRLRR